MFYIQRVVTNSLLQAILTKRIINAYQTNSIIEQIPCNIVNDDDHSNTKQLSSMMNLSAGKNNNNKIVPTYLNNNKQPNTINKVLKYTFSSSSVMVDNNQQPQTTVIINNSQQQQQHQLSTSNDQHIIQVNTQTQQTLFINSNTLQTNLKMNEMREKILGANIINSNNNNSICSIPQKGSLQSLNQNQLQKNQISNQLNLFKQINKKAIAITEYNQYLSRGQYQQYKDYPIVKLTQICSRLIDQHYDNVNNSNNVNSNNVNNNNVNNNNPTTTPSTLPNPPTLPIPPTPPTPLQHWKSLQYFIRKRMHNCSVKDYMKILYITLHTYKDIYKFSHQFMDSLIKGMRQQVTLMEQNQLMQLYIMLSQSNLHNRQQYQMSLKYSKQYQHYQQSKELVKSPYYQHQLLYKLHEQIVQKMVKKYQKKYLKTQLTLRHQDMVKIVWWLRSVLLFHNDKFTTLIKGSEVVNENKNKYVVGLVNVLLGKFVKMEQQGQGGGDTDNMSGKLLAGGHQKKLLANTSKQQQSPNKTKRINIKTPKLLQNKSMQFNSVSQLLEFLSALSLVRDYLNKQSQKQTAQSTSLGSNNNMNLTSSTINMNNNNSKSNINKKNNKSMDSLLLNKNSIWLQKSYFINELIHTVVGYDNVKNMIMTYMFGGDNKESIAYQKQQQPRLQQQIQQVAGQQQINASNDDKDNIKQSLIQKQQQQQHNISYQRKLSYMLERFELLLQISSCKQHYKDSKLVNDWCVQLISRYNIFQLFNQTYQLIGEMNNFYINSQKQDKMKQQSQYQQFVSLYNKLQQFVSLCNKLGACQLQVLYLLYNNIYYVNHNNHNNNNNRVDLNNNQRQSYTMKTVWLAYNRIIQSCFSHLNQQQNQQHKQHKQQQLSIAPSIIQKVINIQLSFYSIRKQQSLSSVNNNSFSQYELSNRLFPAYRVVSKYAQKMIQQQHELYVRELQLPLYTYLGLVLKSNNQQNNQQNNQYNNNTNKLSHEQQLRVIDILQTIKERNMKAKQYLQQHNAQYIQLTNPNNNNNRYNPFINNNNIGSLPSYKNNTSSIAITKHNIITNNNNTSINKQSMLLGEHIMQCVNKQKKMYLRNQQILKITKFFTQIKAFNQLKFAYPITSFLVAPQFVFAINNNNSNNVNSNNSNKKTSNFTPMINPKVLMFLSRQQLIKPQIISQKVIYQASGLQMVIIDRREFLNMHINERIQKLNQLLFVNNSKSGNASTADRVQYLLSRQQQVVV